MKTASQWQEELAGETSIESITRIQADALVAASKICFEVMGPCRAGAQIAALAVQTAIDGRIKGRRP